MRRRNALSALVWGGLLLAGSLRLPAIDIDPSRENEPTSNTSTGNRFSIFSGDPARIQRANSINFKDFDSSLELNPAGTSISMSKADASYVNNVKLTFTIKNVGKRTYTLSFANAQRYEVQIKNPAGQLVYQWSLDKKFDDSVGMVMINPTDRIAYTETISFDSLYAPLEVGAYEVEFSLANYPEIAGKAAFKVTP